MACATCPRRSPCSASATAAASSSRASTTWTAAENSNGGRASSGCPPADPSKGAAPRALAQSQSTGKGKTAMPFYQKGDVRIHYQEAGSGYPLLVLPGGGLNASISFLT